MGTEKKRCASCGYLSADDAVIVPYNDTFSYEKLEQRANRTL